MLETQQGLSEKPWEEREAGFLRWLKSPAGRIARQLRLPEEVAADLKWLIDARNKFAHVRLLNYSTARLEDHETELLKERQRELDHGTLIFNRACERLSGLSDGIRSGASQQELLRIWQGEEPVIPSEEELGRETCN